MRIFTVHIKILCSLVAIVLCRLPLQAATPRDGYDADTLRGRTLGEVVVHRGKQRYSKRNNPAVDFARRIREARDANDPRRKPASAAKPAAKQDKPIDLDRLRAALDKM